LLWGVWRAEERRWVAEDARLARGVVALEAALHREALCRWHHSVAPPLAVPTATVCMEGGGGGMVTQSVLGGRFACCSVNGVPTMSILAST